MFVYVTPKAKKCCIENRYYVIENKEGEMIARVALWEVFRGGTGVIEDISQEELDDFDYDGDTEVNYFEETYDCCEVSFDVTQGELPDELVDSDDFEETLLDLYPSDEAWLDDIKITCDDMYCEILDGVELQIEENDE